MTDQYSEVPNAHNIQLKPAVLGLLKATLEAGTITNQ